MKATLYRYNHAAMVVPIEKIESIDGGNYGNMKVKLTSGQSIVCYHIKLNSN